MTFLLKSIRKQSLQIYKLLINQKPKTAREIGKALGIFPNAVYRGINQLIQIGLVEQIKGRPIKFIAKPLNQAWPMCSDIIKTNFLSHLNLKKEKYDEQEIPLISYIGNRLELFNLAKKDIKQTQREIKLIISGQEVPAEIILAYKKALDRGVKLKILAQSTQTSMLKNWQKMGAEIKAGNNLNVRIFIFDESTVYLTSHNPKNISEAAGIRINYQPLAVLITQLFNQHWQMAKNID